MHAAGKIGVFISILAMIFFSGCQSSGSSMNGFGTQSSGTGTGTTANGTNPYTPLDPGLSSSTISTIATSPAGGGSNCTGTTASSCGFTGFDSSAAGQVISGIDPINPASSSISSDLQTQVQNVVAEAASGNLTQADSQRFTLAGQIMSSCSTDAAAYAPQPGQPMEGTYASSCYNIQATISADSPRFRIAFSSPLPQLPSWIEMPLTTQDTLSYSGTGSAGTLHYKFSFTDLPTAASGTYSSSNAAVPTSCTGTFKMTASANPIPNNAAQGMKVLADCYRKALLLMSPLFDTMFKTMDPQTAQVLILASMGMSPSNP